MPLEARISGFKLKMQLLFNQGTIQSRATLFHAAKLQEADD
jgi:hypothetical protein